MDGQMNNVKVAKEMFDVQESQLENMDANDEGNRNDLLQKVTFQKCPIGTFQKLVDKGTVEYEKVCKDNELLCARLISEEQKVIVGKKIRML